MVIMKRRLIIIGFLVAAALCTFAQSTERPRTILLEGYTSSWCAPCVQGNAKLKSVLEENQGSYALIKYQVNFPGDGDPYYTSEVEVRKLYYGANTAPWLVLNGGNGINTASITNNHLVNLQNVPATMDLEVDFYVEGQTVYAKAKINPTVDITGQNLKLFMAIVEKQTFNNIGPNEETEFEQVMKKFMPNANGITIGNVTANTPVVRLQQWEFKGNYRLPTSAGNPINHNIEHSVENFDNLTVVAWVQAQNKAIQQACNGMDTEQPTVNFIANSGGTITATVAGNPINSGEAVTAGSEITFKATPHSGSFIEEWWVDGEKQTDTSDELTVTFNGNYLDVEVRFITTHANVVFHTVNDFGTLGATANGANIYSGDLAELGAQIMFTATPNEGYEVKEWKYNGEIVAGNIANEFEIQSMSSAVEVTVEFKPTAGVTHPLFSNIQLYPNPFTNVIYITNAENVQAVHVVNAFGHIVKEVSALEKSTIHIDANDLAGGIYFIFLQAANGERAVYKVVK